jgi:hypothetical protein
MRAHVREVMRDLEAAVARRVAVGDAGSEKAAIRWNRLAGGTSRGCDRCDVAAP